MPAPHAKPGSATKAHPTEKPAARAQSVASVNRPIVPVYQAPVVPMYRPMPSYPAMRWYYYRR